MMVRLLYGILVLYSAGISIPDEPDMWSGKYLMQHDTMITQTINTY